MLFTVGHSNRTFDQFAEILISHQINILIDVRGGKAGSRTFPHFNTENLAVEIPKLGIYYQRFQELGGRRGKTTDIDPQLNCCWRLPAFKNYADYAYNSEQYDDG